MHSATVHAVCLEFEYCDNVKAASDAEMLDGPVPVS